MYPGRRRRGWQGRARASGTRTTILFSHFRRVRYFYIAMAIFCSTRLLQKEILRGSSFYLFLGSKWSTSNGFCSQNENEVSWVLRNKTAREREKKWETWCGDTTLSALEFLLVLFYGFAVGDFSLRTNALCPSFTDSQLAVELVCVCGEWIWKLAGKEPRVLLGAIAECDFCCLPNRWRGLSVVKSLRTFSLKHLLKFPSLSRT